MPWTRHGHWMGPGEGPLKGRPDMVARCTYGMCPQCLRDVLQTLTREPSLRWDKDAGRVVYREEAGTIIPAADLRVGHVVRDSTGVLYVTIGDPLDQAALLQLQNGDGHCLDGEDIELQLGPLTLVQTIT